MHARQCSAGSLLRTTLVCPQTTLTNHSLMASKLSVVMCLQMTQLTETSDRNRSGSRSLCVIKVKWSVQKCQGRYTCLQAQTARWSSPKKWWVDESPDKTMPHVAVVMLLLIPTHINTYIHGLAGRWLEFYFSLFSAGHFWTHGLQTSHPCMFHHIMGMTSFWLMTMTQNKGLLLLHIYRHTPM